MAKFINPFVVTGKIEPEYFCDRIKESEKLIKSVINGNNIVVISPRRMGKTGLILHCFDKPEICHEYYTFFFDILHTSSLREFTFLLGRTIYENLASRNRKMLKRFITTLKSINGKLGFDPVSNLPTFNLELGDVDKPEYTLEEIFSYLSNADKPCIVAIDEFQQIIKYPEKNIEALLRTSIQKIANCSFIFAGSERHIMQEMFVSSVRPFYNSADILELNAIAPDVYLPFIAEHFKKQNRSIMSENVEKVYTLFRGHTYYIQKTFNGAFVDTQAGEECTVEIIRDAIDDMIASNDTIFREILSNIPEKQKELLYAIANEGIVTRITSSEFIKSHSLTSASSVQSALSKLMDRELVTETNKEYSLNDKLLALWINKMSGECPSISNLL